MSVPLPPPVTGGDDAQGFSTGFILHAAVRATSVALEAIQCLGGNGHINDCAAGRLLCDARLCGIGAGTSEIRRVLIGRELFSEVAR